MTKNLCLASRARTLWRSVCRILLKSLLLHPIELNVNLVVFVKNNDGGRASDSRVSTAVCPPSSPYSSGYYRSHYMYYHHLQNLVIAIYCSYSMMYRNKVGIHGRKIKLSFFNRLSYKSCHKCKVWM
jgi:hypothetical protein